MITFRLMSPTTNSTFELNHHFEPTNQNSSQKKKEKNHTVLLNFCYSSKQIPSFNLTNQDQIVEIESRNEGLFSQLLSLNHKINKISSTQKQLIQPRNHPKDQKNLACLQDSSTSQAAKQIPSSNPA